MESDIDIAIRKRFNQDKIEFIKDIKKVSDWCEKFTCSILITGKRFYILDKDFMKSREHERKYHEKR